MGIFGLGDSAVKTAPKQKQSRTSKRAKAAEDHTKAVKKTTKSSSQEDEAKALLEKMEAKKDAGECPFC